MGQLLQAIAVSSRIFRFLFFGVLVGKKILIWRLLLVDTKVEPEVLFANSLQRFTLHVSFSHVECF